jgi:di/tripeptidase
VEKIKSDQKLSKEIEENIGKVSSEDHVPLIENCKEAIKKLTEEENTLVPRHDTEAAVILRHIASCYMVSIILVENNTYFSIA